MLSATIQDGNPRTVTYVEDASGQVIRRRETAGTGAASTGTILSDNRWYRFAGAELYESGSAAVGADGIASAAYTIRDGDTLQSIALAMWGDGALWYKLAEANFGISGPGVTGITGPAAALTAGRTLVIPGGVTSTHHNADTFKPYDITEALGNTQPGAPAQPVGPAPKSNNKCGVFGAIMRTVIALVVNVAVRVITAPLALIPVIGPAIQAGLSSAISQGISTIYGLQRRVDWNAVAIAAISAGVNSAFAQIPGAEGFSKKLVGKIVKGAVTNAVTQGISVAAKLQPRFS